jgi:hypothetical protein
LNRLQKQTVEQGRIAFRLCHSFFHRKRLQGIDDSSEVYLVRTPGVTGFAREACPDEVCLQQIVTFAKLESSYDFRRGRRGLVCYRTAHGTLLTLVANIQVYARYFLDDLEKVSGSL